MSLTIAQARDDMAGVIQVSWDAGADTAGKTLLYEDRSGSRPSASVAGAVELWGRLQIHNFDSEQATLVSDIGSRRFRRTGILTLQIFTPQGDGLTVSDAVSQQFLNALEGTVTSGGVIFRNVRTREVGEDGPWFQTTILANYEHDEVK